MTVTAVKPSAEATPPSVHYEMYGGDVTLSFDPEDHQYFARSEKEDFGRVVSSTQVLNNLAKPALQYWAVNETVDYIEEQWEPGRAYDEVEIDEILSDSKDARFSASGKAKKIGTLVHDWIEEYVNAKVEGKSVEILDPGQTPVSRDDMKSLTLPHNTDAQSAIHQFLNWTFGNDIEWIGAEQRAFSRKKRYAGTYDADAIVNGERVLLDWKTSKRIYDEYPLQTAAYVYAREEEGHHNRICHGMDEVRYDQMMILRIPKREGQKFELWRSDSREQIVRLARIFHSLLKVHRWNS